MKAAAPGEYRIAGKTRGRSPYAVSVGEGVPDEAAQALETLFLRPRYSILHSMEPARVPEPGLVDELLERGYAPGSLRLSIFLKGFGVPRKPRIAPTLKGCLLLRWGWLSYDHSPDVTGTWSSPAHKGDLNLLFAALSSHTSPVPLPANEYVLMPSPLVRLGKLGWDFRTLDFRVRKLMPPDAAQ